MRHPAGHPSCLARAPWLLAATVASGCALLSRSQPPRPHYYDPEPPRQTASGDTTSDCVIELGEVSANDELGQSVAFRRSAHEIGYYETRRWSANPDNYLRRALQRALFDRRRCRRSTSGDAPTLDVRLVAFEQRLGWPNEAHVAVHAIVDDRGTVVAEKTLEAVRPFGEGNDDTAFDGFVAAVSGALDDVAEQVVALVLSALPGPPDGP